jgi:hypothetical protein
MWVHGARADRSMFVAEAAIIRARPGSRSVHCVDDSARAPAKGAILLRSVSRADVTRRVGR